jgi:hypothetical protein
MRYIDANIPATLLEGPLLYFIRIYNGFDKKNYYKFGYTANLLSTRLKQLNNEFGAKNRIIVIMLAKTTHEKVEIDIHKGLKYLVERVDIIKKDGKKSKELYEIDCKTYDLINAIMNKNKVGDNLYESATYWISDEDIEWIGTETEIEYYLQNDFEEEYWKDIIN